MCRQFIIAIGDSAPCSTYFNTSYLPNTNSASQPGLQTIRFQAILGSLAIFDWDFRPCSLTIGDFDWNTPTVVPIRNQTTRFSSLYADLVLLLSASSTTGTTFASVSSRSNIPFADLTFQHFLSSFFNDRSS